MPTKYHIIRELVKLQRNIATIFANIPTSQRKMPTACQLSFVFDVMPFIQIRTIERDGKPVVLVSVSVGTERPYYLAKEGLKPRGVYVRRGSACIPLNEAGIRQMIVETSGKSFEERRSLNQDLTFDTLEASLKEKELEFGAEQMKTLKLTGEDGLYHAL